jgi:hypothetical protein
MFIIGIPRMTGGLHSSDTGFWVLYRFMHWVTHNHDAVGIMLVPSTDPYATKWKGKAGIIQGSLSDDRLIVMYVTPSLLGLHESLCIGPPAVVFGQFSYYSGSGVADCVFTNSVYAPALLKFVSSVNSNFYTLPVVTHVLKAPGKTHDNSINEHLHALGLLLSDKVLLFTERELSLSREVLRKYASSAEVARWDRDVVECFPGSPGRVDEVAMPSLSEVCSKLVKGIKGKPLGLVGRIFTSNKRPDKLFQICSYALAKGVPVELISDKRAPSDLKIDSGIVTRFGVKQREWLCKHRPRLGAVLYASNEEGYCLTICECIQYGLPVFVPKRAWAVGLLGKDYPFFWGEPAECLVLLDKLIYGKFVTSELKSFAACVKEMRGHTIERNYESKFLACCSAMNSRDALAGLGILNIRGLESIASVGDGGEVWWSDITKVGEGQTYGVSLPMLMKQLCSPWLKLWTARFFTRPLKVVVKSKPDGCRYFPLEFDVLMKVDIKKGKDRIAKLYGKQGLQKLKEVGLK